MFFFFGGGVQTCELKHEYMDIYIYIYNKIAKNFTNGELKDLCRYILLNDHTHICLDKTFQNDNL